MTTELRRITEGNYGVARLTPAPEHGGTFLGQPKFPKAVKNELSSSSSARTCATPRRRSATSAPCA